MLFSVFLPYLITVFSVGFADQNLQNLTSLQLGEVEEKINKIDHRGKKQGLWVIYEPERMGEDARYQHGYFEDDLKMGTWYIFDRYRNLMGIENYLFDQLNGSVKYYDKNGLVLEGQYYGRSKMVAIDSIIVTHPLTFMDTIVAVHEEIGSFKHGIWNYYDSDLGQLTRREYYQVGNMVKFEEVPLKEVMDSATLHQKIKLLPHNQSNSSKRIRTRSSLIE